MEINKLSVDEIIKLMEAVSRNGITSFELEAGDHKLSLKKKLEAVQAAPAVIPQASALPSAPQVLTGVSMSPAAVPLSPVSSISALDIGSDKVVASPLVGTFYSSSTPEAEAFVKVGDAVKKGQVLGIIEAMKLMNEIECEFDGVVEAILVQNEEIIEFGQPLFRIR